MSVPYTFANDRCTTCGCAFDGQHHSAQCFDLHREDRLVRLRGEDISYLTVIAIHGNMLAFRYDSGTYGWAERSSFVTAEQAEERIQEMRDRRQREQLNERSRIRAELTNRIDASERETQRLRDMLSRYVDDED